MTEHTLAELLDVLGEDVRAVVGDRERSIGSPAPLAEAPPGSLSFCSRSGPEAIELLARSSASVVIVPEDVAADAPITDRRTLIAVPNPRLAFAKILRALYAPPRPRGIHPSAAIDPDARIGPGVYVGPYAVIGAASVGAESVIHSGVHLYDGVTIGRRVVLHSGCVIGSEGFGFERNDSGEPESFPHVGSVVIEDDVELQADCHVSRGTLGQTWIRRGCKFDSGCHIAHNVVVGEDCLVAAHAMIAGSVTIGRGVWIGPSAAISNNVTIGDGASVTIGAVVTRDVEAGHQVTGNLAIDHGRYMAFLKSIR